MQMRNGPAASPCGAPPVASLSGRKALNHTPPRKLPLDLAARPVLE